MTRLLALSALAGLAVGLWLNARDLRRMPNPTDEMAGVQPPDPVTVRPVVVTLPNTLSTDEVGHIRTWLTDHPATLAELYESTPYTRPIGGM